MCTTYTVSYNLSAAKLHCLSPNCFEVLHPYYLGFIKYIYQSKFPLYTCLPRSETVNGLQGTITIWSACKTLFSATFKYFGKKRTFYIKQKNLNGLFIDTNFLLILVHSYGSF